MRYDSIVAVMLAALLVASIPDLAFAATEVFKAPTGFLTDIKTFIEGAPGILLGGMVIGVAAIMAALPRSSVTWGHFGITLIVLCVFYGCFKIAETLQKAYA